MRQLAMIAVAVLAAAACTGTEEPQRRASEPVTTQRWVQRADAPGERTEVAAATAGGLIWVLGGMTGSGQPSPDVMLYNPAFDNWTQASRLPEGVHHAAAASDGTRVWLVGGYIDAGGNHRPTNTVRMAGPDTHGQWVDGPALPEPRAAGALAWDGTRLVFAGGVGPDGLAGDVLALESGRWRRLGELNPAREHLAAASDGQGTTWFLAGRLGGLDTNRTDVDLVKGDQVTDIGNVPTARGGVAGFAVPGLGGCVAGGEQNSGTFREVECITATGATATLPELQTARHGIGAVYHDGVAYVLLGGPSPGLTVSNTVQALRVGG